MIIVLRMLLRHLTLHHVKHSAREKGDAAIALTAIIMGVCVD